MSAENLALNKVKVVIKLLGLGTRRKNTLNKIYVSTYACLIFIFLYLCVVKIFKVWSDIKLLTPTMESLTIFIHCIGKMMALILNQDRISQLFIKMERFWSLEKCSPAVKMDCQIIKQILNAITNTFLFMGHLVMILFFLNTIFSDSDELPVIIYIPETFPYAAVAIIEYVVDVIMVEIMLITDILFIGLCVEAMVQLKLVGYNFERLDFLKGVGPDLKWNIEHHNFILEYCIEIGKISSYSFFAEYAVCTLTTCFELYTVLESHDARYYDFLRGLIYVATLTLELSLYCVTAELLSAEIANVGNSIYKSNWYMSDCAETQKMIILVLLRTQKHKNLSAGGIVSIDMPTFLNVQVFKTAFSFFSCMKAVA